MSSNENTLRENEGERERARFTEGEMTRNTE